MASEFYLEIVTKKGGKIKGESLSAACPGQIEVTKWNFGFNTATDYHGQIAAPMQPEHAEFELRTSIASTPLFQTLCTNDVIKTATLTCRKAGGTGKDWTYMQWRFHDARLIAFKMTGDEGEPRDAIKIAYAGVEISYRQQQADGTLGTEYGANYDQGSNKMVKNTLS